MLDFINNLMIFLGVSLLYLPPLFFTLIRKFLENHTLFIRFNYNVIQSLILTALMSLLIPSATFIFVFYFSFFNIFRFFLNKRFFRDNFLNGVPVTDSEEDNEKRVDIFLLSVYACFMISVLWEWPVQLTSTQNLDAIILSGFKAISIPLFFLLVRQRGFKLNDYWIGALIGGFLHGLISLIYFYNIGYNYETVAFVNMGRFFWIPMIFYSIPKTIYNVKLQYIRRLKR